MGANFANDLAESDLPLASALETHFQHNHYPPIPRQLVPVAVNIINGISGGTVMLDDKVGLPEGIFYRDDTSAPVWACVDAWHLSAFIER